MKTILYTLLGVLIIGLGLAYEAAFVSLLYFICNSEWLLVVALILIGGFIIGDRIRRYGFMEIDTGEEDNKVGNIE